MMPHIHPTGKRAGEAATGGGCNLLPDHHRGTTRISLPPREARSAFSWPGLLLKWRKLP